MSAADGLSDEETKALDYARALVNAGVPVFVAYPDPESGTGFKLPGNWQNTSPNPRYIDAWEPGKALCAVMGQGIDLVDVDPRNGGHASMLKGILPRVHGKVRTPSGGTHYFVRSLGLRSRDAFLQGIDYKGGDADGKGRGFAFLAPTVRASKVTGDFVPYQWVRPPDVGGLEDDDSGGALREAIKLAAGPSYSKNGASGTTAIPAGWERYTGTTASTGAIVDRTVGNEAIDGEWHATVTHIVGQLARDRAPMAVIRAYMEQARSSSSYGNGKNRAFEQQFSALLRDAEKWRAKAVGDFGDPYGAADKGALGDGLLDRREPGATVDSEPPPPFPAEALPPIVRTFCEEVAASTGTPIDFSAVAMLGFIGATAGKRVEIVIKEGSWRESGALWTAVVAPAGSAKSPALDLARVGIDAIQRDAKEAFAERASAYDQQLAAYKASPPKNRDLPPAEPEPMTHFFTTDSTPEALTSLLASADGVACISDELVGLLNSFDQYKARGGKERQFYLSNWAGSSIKVDRKGQRPVVIDRPVVSITGGVQPWVLPQIIGGAGSDGLVERFLWSYPEPAASRWTDADVSPSSKRAIIDVFRVLARVRGEVRLSPDARERFIEWHDANQRLALSETGVIWACPDLTDRLLRPRGRPVGLTA